MSGSRNADAIAMSERYLQNQVRRLCADLGLAVEHVERSDLGKTWIPGWPDLTIVGRTIIFRELKRESEKPTDEQLAVGQRLILAGQDWDVWKPSDLLSGRITQTLVALAGRSQRWTR